MLGNETIVNYYQNLSSAKQSLLQKYQPFDANLYRASHALAKTSFSGELSISTTVAGVLLSINKGSN